jgi:hypothetical protein
LTQARPRSPAVPQARRRRMPGPPTVRRWRRPLPSAWLRPRRGREEDRGGRRTARRRRATGANASRRRQQAWQTWRGTMIGAWGRSRQPAAPPGFPPTRRCRVGVRRARASVDGRAGCAAPMRLRGPRPPAPTGAPVGDRRPPPLGVCIGLGALAAVAGTAGRRRPGGPRPEDVATLAAKVGVSSVLAPIAAGAAGPSARSRVGAAWEPPGQGPNMVRCTEDVATFAAKVPVSSAADATGRAKGLTSGARNRSPGRSMCSISHFVGSRWVRGDHSAFHSSRGRAFSSCPSAAAADPDG